jgi:hypothetical protein
MVVVKASAVIASNERIIVFIISPVELVQGLRGLSHPCYDESRFMCKIFMACKRLWLFALFNPMNKLLQGPGVRHERKTAVPSPSLGAVFFDLGALALYQGCRYSILPAGFAQQGLKPISMGDVRHV